MSTYVVFTPDDQYDRDHASDGESRYGAYLRRNLASFLDIDDWPTGDPLEFAAAAWRVAQSPVMSPAYVTAHPRVLSTSVGWDFEHCLAITVEVASGVPREVARGLRGSWTGWREGDPWFDEEANDRPVASSVLKFRVPMPEDGLPEPAYRAASEPDTEVAKEAVEIVCGRLNAALGGAFSRFDRKEVA
ncbi:hypothetical protein FHX42_002663 [Saccharopolyspora lacisalsi]|uniref:Uncharacterized protein n=1 Tax=Halosaccharopolyspora lacisalsi TaxID=1000566 RepID=A0A839DTL5_9PSEU|nr:hypothetical protein [Halosaccharopolyspora lacisalsi]MBA8825312.1 hypothetical protein [Halosaccharopolyspora lacisalsi]